MSRPPERLVDKQGSEGAVEARSRDLLRALQEPPRFEAAAHRRLERKVAQIASTQPGPRRWVAMAASVAAAAAILVAVHFDRRHDEGVRARGVPPIQGAPMSSPELLTFRIGPSGRSEPLGDVIRRGDELAFAYRTDGSVRRVLVFARDERGHIFWFHPAWTDPAANPEAIQLAATPGVHELPAAISQPFQGEQLEICGLFTTKTLRVREVEQELALRRLRPDCRRVTVVP
jgi:hypothetical protein